MQHGSSNYNYHATTIMKRFPPVQRAFRGQSVG
jgi:hypothetical protein